jgi:cytochrome c556
MLAVGAVLAASFPAQAEDKASDAEKAVEYRKGVFTAMGYNIKPMAAMMKGKIAWDSEEFAMRAQRIADLADMPWEGFQEGTSNIAHSHALDAVWEDTDKFRKLREDLVEQSAELAEVAQGGDRKAVAPAFKKVGKTCKSCHDDFKEED